MATLLTRLQDLPTLLDQGLSLIAVETPLTERNKILQFLAEIATKRQFPLFFWNQGYSRLQQVKALDLSSSTQIQLASTTFEISPHSGLGWLLTNDQPGIFVFEGALLPSEVTGTFSQSQMALLSNLAYQLALPNRNQVLVCLDNYVELPLELVPLIPVLVNQLPDTQTVQQLCTQLCANRFSSATSSELRTLVQASLGLPLGELEMVLQRSVGLVNAASELVAAVLHYKKTKLRSKGVEFISEPDVPAAGGLDLLDAMLERAAALLKPEAAAHNLRFPKGYILWGPPGTGKSLSAKLAAKKMGVPMVACDWGGLRGATAHESRKNLREFLQFCDSQGDSGLVVYFDDFDKGFAGFDSDSDGGVSRQLAGKLLTWMQEHTSKVLVLATVNRLEFLPPELIRRFDDIVFVDLPHAGARYEIFKLHMAKYFPDLKLSEKEWWRLLRESHLLTPAEIGNMVRKTAEEVFYRNTKVYQPEELNDKPLEVTVKDFLEQRYLFTPAMIRDEDKIIDIRNKAAYARPATSPDRSRWAREPQPLFGALSSQ